MCVPLEIYKYRYQVLYSVELRTTVLVHYTDFHSYHQHPHFDRLVHSGLPGDFVGDTLLGLDIVNTQLSAPFITIADRSAHGPIQ